MINNPDHYKTVINQNNPETPEDIVNALWVRQQIRRGLSLDELMDAYFYELSDVSRLLLNGRHYHKQGYRLKNTDDAPVGAANTIVMPTDAIAWRYQESGHTASSARCFYLYVVKVDNNG